MWSVSSRPTGSRIDLARLAVLALIGCCALAPAAQADASAALGQAAPDFTLTDASGAQRSLAEFRGKTVVLEWVNPECPFVKKHYGSGNMQALQTQYAGQGVAWLSINSSAPGKQGHLTGETGQAFLSEAHAAPTALLLDPDGQMGRLYGAKTTPHMFIVNADGVLVYAGAIDDTPSADPNDIPTAINYVAKALDEILAGAPVSVAQTQSYGCSVKY